MPDNFNEDDTSGYCLQTAIDKCVAYAPPSKSCKACGVTLSKLQKVIISTPIFMIIQIPTIQLHKGTVVQDQHKIKRI